MKPRDIQLGSKIASKSLATNITLDTKVKTLAKDLIDDWNYITNQSNKLLSIDEDEFKRREFKKRINIRINRFFEILKINFYSDLTKIDNLREDLTNLKKLISTVNELEADTTNTNSKVLEKSSDTSGLTSSQIDQLEAKLLTDVERIIKCAESFRDNTDLFINYMLKNDEELANKYMNLNIDATIQMILPMVMSIALIGASIAGLILSLTSSPGIIVGVAVCLLLSTTLPIITYISSNIVLQDNITSTIETFNSQKQSQLEGGLASLITLHNQLDTLSKNLQTEEIKQ